MVSELKKDTSFKKNTQKIAIRAIKMKNKYIYK